MTKRLHVHNCPVTGETLLGPASATDWPRERERCEARTRSGAPCRAPANPKNGRCKLHGGASTGPKSAEAREAARQRMLALNERRRAARAGIPQPA